MPIRTVLLDAGGVLVFPNWDRVSRVCQAHGIPVSPAALRQAEPRIKFAIDQAAGQAASSDAARFIDYLGGVLHEAGVPASPERDAALADVRAYHAAENVWESVPPDVFVALDRLKAIGLTLAVASNANGTIHRCLDRVGLAPYFDVICDSFVEGVEKPDPRFFQLILERSGGDADTTLHVGDLYHVDVIGARRAGLRALLLDQHDMYGAFDADRIRSLAELVERFDHT